MKKTWNIFIRLLPVILLVVIGMFLAQSAYARAGGAGGGRSGGGSDGGGNDDNVFDVIFDLIALTFEYPALGITGIILFLGVLYFTKIRNKD